MLLILAALFACAVDQDRLGRPADADPPTLEAPPPPAQSPVEDALYQVLFADETGAEARSLGDRARTLAWFSYMELTPDQLRALTSLVDQIAEDEATIREAEAAMAARELEALAPVHAELIERLATPKDLDEDELARLGTELAAARERTSPGTLYRARHEALRSMLDHCRTWIEDLDEGQQTALGTSRYLLRQRVGPLVAPGDHADLLGTVWDGAAFDTLVLGRLPQGEEPLDIGGLWASEEVRNTPDHQLGGVQKQVLVLMLARQPGLTDTVEVALGSRPALDGMPTGPSPAPADEADDPQRRDSSTEP